MNYAENKVFLKRFYEQNGLLNSFENDSQYLENAFNDIYEIWLDNLSQIKTVNYLLIAEAPLWGKVKKYIYNPETNNSQFFYKSDLEIVLNKRISNKKEFLKTCNEIGLLVLDISPFALNAKDTAINYRCLKKKQYQELVRKTIPTFFEKKIKIIEKKKSPHAKVFFRYARVKNNFEEIISNVLITNQVIKSKNEIGDISGKGGGIDKPKLKQILQFA